MGLGDFFRKLFGGAPEANDPPPIEQTPDPIKDASDYVMAHTEIVPEKTEPIVEKTAFAEDANEDYTEPLHSPDENRFEESAD